MIRNNDYLSWIAFVFIMCLVIAAVIVSVMLLTNYGVPSPNSGKIYETLDF